MTRVGFVGIGAIGLPMAKHLVTAGFEVVAFDASPARLEEAAAAGMLPAASAGETAKDADAVLVMVATPQQLHEAVLGDGGVAEGIAAGTCCVIMSTVGVDGVHAVAEALAERGIGVLDVPVTGGVARAETGTLTLLAGGDLDLLARHTNLLTPMGRIVLCGPAVGDGQAVKLVNQLLCSIHLAAAAEALAFAEALGLDPDTVLEIVKDGAAGSWMLSDRGPRMLAEDPPVRSAVDIFVKDATLVADAAGGAGFDAPLLTAAASRFRAAAAAGLGRADDSRVITTYRAAGPGGKTGRAATDAAASSRENDR
ncbi:NAD(P)-dependent oxidoreductase [Streptomyces griseorubiginosus]|uniref:NAD(P)-dependent oxidoreductase n=1 Tax=Streptomyces griseorubiginosus TaxID=67304 RepID=UPI00369A568F